MRLGVAIATALALVALAAPALSQATGPIAYLPALAGDYFALDSKLLARRIHIFIRLPEKYSEEPDKKYPVVSCCRFRGHRDKVFDGTGGIDGTTEVQPGVQA